MIDNIRFMHINSKGQETVHLVVPGPEAGGVHPGLVQAGVSQVVIQGVRPPDQGVVMMMMISRILMKTMIMKTVRLCSFPVCVYMNFIYTQAYTCLHTYKIAYMSIQKE
jgi:hypothetical protein